MDHHQCQTLFRLVYEITYLWTAIAFVVEVAAMTVFMLVLCGIYCVAKGWAQATSTPLFIG